MPDTMTLELKRDDACLWLHVTNGQQHGLFNLGSGLRENGQDVLAVQVLRECIAHYAALSQSSTNPTQSSSKLVGDVAVSDGWDGVAYANMAGELESWKRRALQAEHFIEHEVQGQTFMGEPLLRAPAEQGGSVDAAVDVAMGEKAGPVGDEKILWGLVANAGRCSAERKQRWAHVLDAAGLGSQSSIELCRRFGFDPDEQVGGEQEACESHLPDCGSVAHWDSEGIPLCERCWNELAKEG